MNPLRDAAVVLLTCQTPFWKVCKRYTHGQLTISSDHPQCNMQSMNLCIWIHIIDKRAVFWVTGYFSTLPENCTVRAFLQLTPCLPNDYCCVTYFHFSGNFLLWPQPWSALTIMLLWGSIIIIKYNWLLLVPRPNLPNVSWKFFLTFLVILLKDRHTDQPTNKPRHKHNLTGR